MTCECPRHPAVALCEQPATRLTYDRDPRYTCADCTTEDDSRALSEAEKEGSHESLAVAAD